MIVEPTSGNTGIALAMVCAARGYELVLTLPEGMSRERTKLLRAYGAEVHETPSLGGMGEAIELARGDRREQRKGFMPQQFSNPANPEVHRRTTARRSGTTSTARSTRCLRGRHGRHDHRGRPGAEGAAPRPVVVVAVEPAGSPVLSGGMPGPAQDPGDRRRASCPRCSTAP